MNLLIVEDEPLILKGLRHIIAKSSLGFSRIDVAESGEKALSLFKSRIPSILITDIKLPGISGLELIEELRTGEEKIPCIIISGHAQFDYAQKAISLDINKYLLKPVIPEKLIKAIEESIELLKRRKLEKQLFIRYMLERNGDENMTRQYLGNLGISMVNPCFALIRIFQKAETGNLEDFGNYLTMELKELSSHSFSTCVIDQSYFILINSPRMDSSEKIAEKTGLAMANHPGKTSFFGGMSPFTKKPEDLGRFNACIKGELENHLTQSGPFFTLCSDEQPQLSPVINRQIRYLAEAIEMDEEKSIAARIMTLLASLQNTGHRTYIRTVLSELRYELQGKKKIYNLLSENSIDRLIFSSGTIEDLIDKMTSLFHEIGNSRMVKDAKKTLSDHVTDYIDKHFADPLDLHILSVEFSVNYNYLSGNFKKKTGLSITRYVNTIRIEAAKRLLLETDEKIYAIALDTGYSDDKYFMKVFKEITGLSPGEYRTSAGK